MSSANESAPGTRSGSIVARPNAGAEGSACVILNGSGVLGPTGTSIATGRSRSVIKTFFPLCTARMNLPSWFFKVVAVVLSTMSNNVR